MSEESIEANEGATLPSRSPALTRAPSGGTPPSGASYRPWMVLCMTPLRLGLATMRPLKRTVRVLVSIWTAAVRIVEQPLGRLGHEDAAVRPARG